MPSRSDLACLSPAEAALLEAILDRLIPSDESGPGAREARVLRYIDRALAGPLADLRDAYAEGLPAIDTYAVAETGTRFVGLAADAQDALLAQIDAGTAAEGPASFFDTVRTHAIQGMFGDPSHGGNEGGAGWELIGFPGPKGTFAAEDQALDAVVAPVRLRS